MRPSSLGCCNPPVNWTKATFAPLLPFAKALGMAPACHRRATAEATSDHPSLESINAVNGYLNIPCIAGMARNQLLTGNHRSAERKRREVLIEHTSANPNGLFHVGRARNAILGDTLVRLHRLWGDNCYRRVLR